MWDDKYLYQSKFNQRCNCDQNTNIWTKDSGYLVDKNTLPVTESRFGDTGTHYGFDEFCYHTLGKLQCWASESSIITPYLLELK